MICTDKIKLESIAAQKELGLLRGMTVGDTREGVLLPALEVGVSWRLVLATDSKWEFDGEFFGQPFYRLEIWMNGEYLMLNVLEAR